MTTYSISLPNHRCIQISISSWLNLGKLHGSKNLFISSRLSNLLVHSIFLWVLVFLWYQVQSLLLFQILFIWVLALLFLMISDKDFKTLFYLFKEKSFYFIDLLFFFSLYFISFCSDFCCFLPFVYIELCFCCFPNCLRYKLACLRIFLFLEVGVSFYEGAVQLISGLREFFFHMKKICCVHLRRWMQDIPTSKFWTDFLRFIFLSGESVILHEGTFNYRQRENS